MRDMNPDIVSLPQYLISQGYSTQGIGKIYDVRCVDKNIDKPSWSVPFYKTDKNLYSKETGMPVLTYYQNPETKRLGKMYYDSAIAKGLKEEAAVADGLLHIKPSSECMDVPDDAYVDGVHAKQATNLLVELSKKDQPFFLGVGFSKPHLPFVAPKKYWDLYNREDMPVAEFQDTVKDGVSIAYHNAGEIRSYTDIPTLNTFTDQKPYGITLPIDKQKELIHAYHAAVSYTDAQVGLLLNALDSLGLTENTIIVLWGDHGWHLGDHNLWCKHSDFENATRAPLLIAAPGMKSSVVKTPTEFVDIFPTLCDLVGVNIPTDLDGKTLVPAMKNPTIKIKEFSVSQYPRSSPSNEKDRLGYANADYMGYSIRTERYRYTVWMKSRWRTSKEFNQEFVLATELYDYKKDKNETINFAKQKKYAAVVAKMNSYMIAYFAGEYKKSVAKK
jgi:arylsulfatase A-like enzyme